MEPASLSKKIKEIIRKSLKWYSYSLIYFLVASLPCIYAWYTCPIPYRAGIRAVFRTIALIPTLMLAGAITAWIFLVIFLILLLHWLKKRFPEFSICRKSTDSSQRGAILWEVSSSNKPINFWSKPVNVSISVLGIILIIAGLSIALWISRPYITLLFSTSKIEALERKAALIQQVQIDSKKKTAEDRIRNDKLQQVLEKKAEFSRWIQKDWIIIPAALVDAPILDGVSLENLALGVCHVSESAVPSQGGNCIIEGHNLGTFGWWRSQGPFNMLQMMEEGIHIYVFYKGKKYSYKVKEKHYKDANDPKLYDFTPGERLTLITCTSSWDPAIYTNKRTVVVAYPM